MSDTPMTRTVIRRRDGTAERRITQNMDTTVVHVNLKGTKDPALRLGIAIENLRDAVNGARVVETTKPLRIDQMPIFESIVKSITEAAGTDFAQVAEFRRLVAPPRTGKAVVIGDAIAAAGTNALVLVPTRTLVDQFAAELMTQLPTVKVAKYYGGEKNLAQCGVVVATYDSIQRDFSQQTLSDALADVTFVFCDEGHRAMSPARQHMLHGAFGRHTVRIAVTASPDYNSDRTLATFFPKLIHEITLVEAVEMELFAPFKVEVVEVDVDGSMVTLRSGDYNEEQLGRIMSEAPMLAAACTLRYLPENAILPCLLCCATVKQAKDLLHYLNIHKPEGVTYPRLITGTTPSAERQQWLADFEAGRLDTLVNVGVLLEGWNSPRCKLEIDMAPTTSKVRALQKFFRPLTKDGNRAGKIICLMPKRLGKLPYFPQDLFGQSIQVYGLEDFLKNRERDKEARKKSKKRKKLKRLKMRLIDRVDPRMQTIATFSGDDPILNVKNNNEIRNVVASGYGIMDRMPPYELFAEMYFSHRLFSGYGRHLLRYCGYRPTMNGLVRFVTRLYPDVGTSWIMRRDSYFRNDGGSTLHDRAGIMKYLNSAGHNDLMLDDYGWHTYFGATEDNWDPVAELDHAQTIALLKEQFAGLTDKQRYVLTLLYGLDNTDEHTLEQIGKTMLISRERVRQIALGAIDVLRRSLIKKLQGNHP